MELIIELSGRGSHGHEFQKFSGQQITVGRAMDNDLILSDPHVCAHHATISLNEDGEAVINDLGSINGCIVNKHKYINRSVILNSGEDVQLGKTRLRVFLPSHDTPASIRLSWVEQLAHQAGRPLNVALVCLLMLLMTMYAQYTAEIAEYNFGRQLLTGIGAFVVLAIWPVGWSLFARYKKHEARFLAQFSATIAFAIFVRLLEKLNDWLAYHAGANAIMDGLIMAITAVFALLLIWFNLYLSIFLGAKRRWFISAGLTAVFAGIMYIGSTVDYDSFNGRPEYTAKLFPPSVSFYNTESIQSYLNDASAIFKSAQENIELEAD